MGLKLLTGLTIELKRLNKNPRNHFGHWSSKWLKVLKKAHAALISLRLIGVIRDQWGSRRIIRAEVSVQTEPYKICGAKIAHWSSPELKRINQNRRNHLSH